MKRSYWLSLQFAVVGLFFAAIGWGVELAWGDKPLVGYIGWKLQTAGVMTAGMFALFALANFVGTKIKASAYYRHRLRRINPVALITIGGLVDGAALTTLLAFGEFESWWFWPGLLIGAVTPIFLTVIAFAIRGAEPEIDEGAPPPRIVHEWKRPGNGGDGGPQGAA